MSGEPVVLRERARRDIDEAIEHYLAEAGQAIAISFIDALEDTFRRISEHPESGSPRHAHELGILGLRFQSTGRFPYLVFYIEREAELDIWRVLHAARDIPAGMRVPAEN